MQLESMVTDSKFDDILFKLTSEELCAVSRFSAYEEGKIPLINGAVSADRFLEFVKMTAATVSKPESWHPRNCPALFLRAYSKAGDWVDDNVTGLLGVWQKGGEEF